MNVFKAAAPLLASVALVSSPAMAQVEVQTFIGEDGISYILDTERYPASYYLIFGPVPLGDGPMNAPRVKNDFAGADRINAELVRLGQVRIGDNVYDINQGCEISRDYYTNMYSPDYVSFQIFTGGFCEDTGESSEDVRWVSYDMQNGEALDYAAIVPGLKLVAPDYDYESGQVTYRSEVIDDLYFKQVQALAAENPNEDCADLWTRDQIANQSYTVYASAEYGGISASPDLPQVSRGCGDVVTIKADGLAAYGAPERLVRAIRIAHEGGHWAPQYNADGEAASEAED